MIMESVMCFWRVSYWCSIQTLTKPWIDHKDENPQTNYPESRSFDKGCAQREDKKAEEGAARKICQ
jgi:hypothetical protein